MSKATHSSISLDKATSAVENKSLSVYNQFEKKHKEKFLHNKFQGQLKLTVGTPDDPLGYEADAVAGKVMWMPEQSFVQRKCATCEEEEKVQRKPEEDEEVQLKRDSTNFIQIKCAGCEKEDKKQVHRKPLGESITPFTQIKSEGSSTVIPSVALTIESLRGGGTQMDSNTNSFMSSRFGTGFSHVKVHTDNQAVQLSRNLNAKAFTVGNDVYFNEGQYTPNSTTGKLLLAHELVHVMQQNQVGNNRKVQRSIGDGHDLSSPRFARDTVLEDVFDGTSQLSTGSRGDPVQKVQHALQDAGSFLAGFGVDGIYETETARAVTHYQGRKGINADPSGTVGPNTMTALDNDFQTVSDAPATLTQNPADLACIQQILCPWNRALVNDFRSGTFTAIFVDRLFWADEMFDGSAWVSHPMEGAGETSGSVIRVDVNKPCDQAAQTLYHEYQHARSPRRLRRGSWADEESHAYTLETSWSIARGLTPDPSLVTTDPVSGETVVDTSGVQSQVGTYPGMVSGSSEEVIAKVGTNRVRVRRSNGTVYVRNAVSGDTVPGPRRIVNPRTIGRSSWSCP